MSKDFSSVSEVPVSEQQPAKQWRVALLALIVTIVLFYVAEILGGLIISIYPALHHWSAAQTNNWLNNSVEGQFVFGYWQTD
jgi:hypothetical protein